VPAAGSAAAVLASDLVVVEALASSATDLLATQGSRALASVAYCAEVPVWAVIGRGRCLPAPLFDAMGGRASVGPVPWENDTEIVPLALTNWVARPDGVLPTADLTMQPECPMSYELLRSSAM
jgi:hypothetical protein